MPRVGEDPGGNGPAPEGARRRSRRARAAPPLRWLDRGVAQRPGRRRLTLAARPDGRTVTTDDTAGMFAVVHGDALTAPSKARIAPTHYTDWLAAPRA